MGAMSNLFGQAGGKDSVSFEADERKESELSETFTKFAENWLVKVLGGGVFSANAIGWVENQETLEEMAAGKRKGFSSDDLPTVIRRGMAVETIGKIGNARSQMFLENLATTDPIPEIREFAAGEVKNQNILTWIVKNEENPAVLKAAIGNVKRPDVLEEAMLNNYKNASVFGAIRDRIMALPVSVQSTIGSSPKRAAFSA